MAYFDLGICMRDGKLTYMECALESSKVFLENERREAEIRSERKEAERRSRQRKIEQDASLEKATRIVFFVTVIFVVILIVCCTTCMKKKKRVRNRSSERNSRTLQRCYNVEDNQTRHITVDHVTCQGVHGHENQGRLLEGNSSVPVHQRIEPSAPILPINYPTSTPTTSNVFGNNRSNSTGNLEQISEDSPPTYDDCMKNINRDLV